MTDQYHRPKIESETFRRLEMFRVKNSLKNSNEAIDLLLRQVEDQEPTDG